MQMPRLPESKTRYICCFTYYEVIDLRTELYS